MKEKIYCPYCLEEGKRTVIGRYEDVMAEGGYYYSWCRRCRREIPVDLGRISLSR